MSDVASRVRILVVDDHPLIRRMLGAERHHDA